MTHRPIDGFLMLSAMVALAACTGRTPVTPNPGSESASDAPLMTPQGSPTVPVTGGVFPRPSELEPQVAFWRNVYGVWKRSQVVLHDDRHLSLIYEIVNLPGALADGYTPAQQDLLSRRRNYWKDRLGELEHQVNLGIPLNSDEQDLAAYIVRNAGSGAALNGARERLRAQRGLRERFRRGLEISGRYDRLIKQMFRQSGLPEELAYLPHVESSFQAHARSSAGAVGIWQFTLAAARTFMNVDAALDERLDPVASARGAARYLSHAHSRLGTWPLAITSYNHGIGGMQRARESFGDDFVSIVKRYDHPQFGFASRNFYAEFLAARDVATQAERFFPEGIRYDPPLNWDRVILRQDVPVSAIARYYETEKWQLIAMNVAWTTAAKADEVPLPAGTEVWLPPGTLRRGGQR